MDAGTGVGLSVSPSEANWGRVRPDDGDRDGLQAVATAASSASSKKDTAAT